LNTRALGGPRDALGVFEKINILALHGIEPRIVEPIA
jgi:hypothetical protein